jgi:hypothetical protein
MEINLLSSRVSGNRFIWQATLAARRYGRQGILRLAAKAEKHAIFLLEPLTAKLGSMQSIPYPHAVV